MAQACHGMAEFARDHRDEFMAWITGSNYIVCLQVEDEAALLSHAEALSDLPFNLVYEPDISEHTAIVIAPGPYHTKVSHLPLAGKELAMSP